MYEWVLKKIVGSKNQRDLKKLEPILRYVNDLEAEIQELSDEELAAKTRKFRAEIAEREEQGERLDDILNGILPEAFAVCREAGLRTLGMRHYDVQIIGGIVQHQGKITEMKTGEGKTLVATLPIYLNALTGRGVHLITVNDYLAKRDAEWMGKIYRFLGLTVGVITHDKSNEERKEAYRADITYGTNNEFGFDYLRDNMKYSLEQYVQRPLNYAIVDEVDSILIDEARTPLIISGPTEQSTDTYHFINERIEKFVNEEKSFGTDPTLDPEKEENAGRFYQIDLEHKSCILTEEGVQRLEEILELENLYAPEQLNTVHHVQQALAAHTLYARDVEYVVQEGKVTIVDEFTGRLMDGRRWSDGLHQAVEAKEAKHGVKIENENQTLATITYQNYFKMYNKLAGMTGTAETEASEFHSIYELDVIVIPTHKPLIRVDDTDLIFKNHEYKVKAVVEDVKEINDTGAPVLIGTTSVESSEEYSRALLRAGIRHEVLNAKNHFREAEIVAQAGSVGSVTIATNMAGRGTDIVLGGNPEHFAWNQLNKRGFDSSDLLGDQFIRAVLTGNRKLAAEYLNDERLDEQLITLITEHRDQQKVNQAKVLEYGGLHIIGTERHESRRVDNQLRGRAGRQGDPGYSRFYLALDDDLIKVFGGDRILGIMERLGMDDEPIEHRMLNKSIEGAQKRVEGRNFEIRKNLLEYDDVMNSQRSTIYGERRAVLGKEQLVDKVQQMCEDIASDWIDEFVPARSYPEDWDWTGMRETILATTNISMSQPDEEELENMQEADLIAKLDDLLKGLVRSKQNEFGEEMFGDFLQYTMLEVLDDLWRDHLLAMDNLKQGIGLRGYGQKDPKREYQKEGFGLFQQLIALYRQQVVQRVALVRLVAEKELNLDVSQLKRDQLQEGYGNISAPPPSAPAGGNEAIPGISGPRAGAPAQADPLAQVRIPRTVGEKTKPNEPCPCGSGKKYKQCHGRRA